MLQPVVLNNLRVLAVTGSDRASFLQGQLTQDVSCAGPEVTVLAGWADAKGRLLFVGHLFSMRAGTDDALALLAPAELADRLLNRLRMYVLRAKVQVALLDVAVVGIMGSPADAVGANDVKLSCNDGRRFLLDPVADTEGNGGGAHALNDWQLADIRAGLPTILTATTSEFVPQMVNLDLLGGISFTKGCYTGQEIVARMKYLGRVKRRMLRFATTGIPPTPGAPLYAERGSVGQVVSSAPTENGSEFLAVVVLDDLRGPCYIDAAKSQAVRRLDLPYEVSL